MYDVAVLLSTEDSKTRLISSNQSLVLKKNQPKNDFVFLYIHEILVFAVYMYKGYNKIIMNLSMTSDLCAFYSKICLWYLQLSETNKFVGRGRKPCDIYLTRKVVGV